MTYNVFRYSTKVWLTAVAGTPLIFWAIQLFRENLNNVDILKQLPEVIPFYLITIFYEFLFSFITWLVFTGIIRLIMTFPIKHVLRRWLIFISGLTLTIVTFFIILQPLNFWADNDFLILTISNSAVIGWGCWFYKINLDYEY